MANLISEYRVFVYDDGTLDIKSVQNESNQVNTDGTSSSIRQIVKVLEYVAFSGSDSSMRKRISEGINSVAQAEGITTPSVHAKILRKLELTMDEFKNLVEQYFEGKNDELEKKLRKACVARTKSADNSAIEQLFGRIKAERIK